MLYGQQLQYQWHIMQGIEVHRATEGHFRWPTGRKRGFKSLDTEGASEGTNGMPVISNWTGSRAFSFRGPHSRRADF